MITAPVTARKGNTIKKGSRTLYAFHSIRVDHMNKLDPINECGGSKDSIGALDTNDDYITYPIAPLSTLASLH